MLKTLFGAALAGALGIAGAASAQTFPTRPMTLVIPFAAGGPTDVLGRVMAEAMSKSLGQQVVVENVGGAGGGTGSQRVARAAPDGYTLLLGTVGTHAQNQTLYKKPLYNAATDFQPVGLIAEVPLILHRPQGLPGELVRGVRRLFEGEPGQDDRTARPAPARRRISAASSSTRRWARRSSTCPTAAPARRCRTCRADGSTSVRDRLDGAAADPGRLRQGHRDDDQDALAGAAGAGHRPREGHRELRGADLERLLPAEGNAGGDRTKPARGHARDDRYAGLCRSGCRASAPARRAGAALGGLLATLRQGRIEKWAAPIGARVGVVEHHVPVPLAGESLVPGTSRPKGRGWRIGGGSLPASPLALATRPSPAGQGSASDQFMWRATSITQPLHHLRRERDQPRAEASLRRHRVLRAHAVDAAIAATALPRRHQPA